MAKTLPTVPGYDVEGEDAEGKLILVPKKAKGSVDLSPVLDRLSQIEKKLDKLDAVESHLLDLLIPGRNAHKKAAK